MFGRSAISLFITFAVALNASASAPRLPPQRIGWHLVNGVWLRASGACDWTDLIQFEWQGDDLTAELAPTARGGQLLRGNRHAAIEIGQAKDLYDATLKIPPHLARFAALPSRYLEIRALHELAHDGVDGIDDFDSPRRADDPTAANITAPLRPMLLSAAPGMFRINARGQWRGENVSITIGYAHAAPAGHAVSLLATIDDGKARLPKQISITAESLAALIDQHPVQARQYLSPIFRMLGRDGAADLIGPGAADVYRAFPNIAPSPQARDRLRQILPRMLADDFRARAAAMQELQSLGAAGISAAIKLDLPHLAPQQRVFIEQVLSEQSRHGIDQIAALRGQPIFLIDCLHFPDPAIRAAAIEALSKQNHAVSSIDPNNAAACLLAAEQLLDALAH